MSAVPARSSARPLPVCAGRISIATPGFALSKRFAMSVISAEIVKEPVRTIFPLDDCAPAAGAEKRQQRKNRRTEGRCHRAHFHWILRQVAALDERRAAE
jgi:hypothetical protein